MKTTTENTLEVSHTAEYALPRKKNKTGDLDSYIFDSIPDELKVNAETPAGTSVFTALYPSTDKVTLVKFFAEGTDEGISKGYLNKYDWVKVLNQTQGGDQAKALPVTAVCIRPEAPKKEKIKKVVKEKKVKPVKSVATQPVGTSLESVIGEEKGARMVTAPKYFAPKDGTVGLYQDLTMFVENGLHVITWGAAINNPQRFETDKAAFADSKFKKWNNRKAKGL